VAAVIESRFAQVDGLRLHYLEAGEGEPVLLLHGWPTSAQLWRNVIGPLAQGNRVIALDLPGFGASDKPLDASYSFRFHDRAISGFLDSLGIERIGLAVHDLGGPIGLYWASEHPERLSRLALLNTIVFAKPSWAVIAFVAAARLPGVRSWMASPAGLAFAMRLGVHDRSRLSDEAILLVQEPFADRDARKALLKAGTALAPGGMRQIEHWLQTIQVPVRIIYGARDRILPDVAKTMKRVAELVEVERVTVLEDCGHFLQEERPEEIGRQLAAFFGAEPASRRLGDQPA
jgi:pimeloyl-ACP methyl ester carboxylesterase